MRVVGRIDRVSKDAAGNHGSHPDEWSDSTLGLFIEEIGGDRHTPLLFDSLITPIFPESAVREVMARAEAAERAAAERAAADAAAKKAEAEADTHIVWPKAAPVVERWQADTPMNGIRVPLQEFKAAVPALPPANSVARLPRFEDLDDDDDVEPPTALHMVASRGNHISWMIWLAVALFLTMLIATVCKAGKRLSHDDTMRSQWNQTSPT